VYAGPITLTHTAAVAAIATASGMSTSDVASAAYVVLQQVATPAFSPNGGTYVSSVAVSLTDATPGAAIYYTTDGSTPTTSSTAYAGPVTLAQSRTLRAIAAAAGMADSAVATAAYVVQAATPTFGLAGGTYNTPQTVSLATATSGATIRYTTDGSTPTAASPAYTGAISVTQTTTVRAIATASGMVDSGVASATYTLQAATPTFSPAGGAYLLPMFVSISTTTAGATIYYTTDGTTPTTSSTPYTGSILVGVGNTTIKAIAVRAGWSQSLVATAAYHVGL
jgi:hypothetical protein